VILCSAESALNIRFAAIETRTRLAFGRDADGAAHRPPCYGQSLMAKIILGNAGAQEAENTGSASG
jgi:hypothetical protein